MTDIKDSSINKYTDSKTIQEANEFTEKVIDIKKAYYTRIDIRCVNEYNQWLYEMKEKFPKVFENDNISFVGATQNMNDLVINRVLDYLTKEKYSQKAIAETIRELKEELKISPLFY